MAGGVDVSLYESESGPTLNVLFGLHVHDYLMVQANYIDGESAYRPTGSTAAAALTGELRRPARARL
jgi:hypothetical protein